MTTSLRQAMRCGLEKTLAELDPTALDGMSVSSDERLDRRLTWSPESATTACRLADDSVAGAIGCLKRAAGLQLVAWDLGRDSARDVRRDSIGSVLACANPRAQAQAGEGQVVHRRGGCRASRAVTPDPNDARRQSRMLQRSGEDQA